MSARKPPHLADRFLSWFCKSDLLEEIQGDLYVQWQRNYERHSPMKAKLLYWFQVLHFLRPFALKKTSLGNSIRNLLF